MDKAADDAASTHWLDIAMVNGKLQLTDGDKTLYHDDLAFDHWEILLIAMERIKGRLEYCPYSQHYARGKYLDRLPSAVWDL